MNEKIGFLCRRSSRLLWFIRLACTVLWVGLILFAADQANWMRWVLLLGFVLVALGLTDAFSENIRGWLVL